MKTPVLLLARELNLGGTERQLTETAKALDRERFEPHVGCFRPDGMRAQDLGAAGVPVTQFPVESLVSLDLFDGARAMGRYIRQHGIRLVHTFDVPMNVFAVPAARCFGAPVVLSSQRAYRDLSGSQRHLLRLTDRVVDGIVVNCEAMRRHLIEDERVPRHMVHLCYNGIDVAEFSPGRRAERERLTIGVICAIRREKGLETLLEAFAGIDGPADLRIIGSGPHLAELEAHARRLNLGERCRFEPATQQVAERLREIDIFVLPSLSEAFSNSLMEAMACGCAAVASRVGGNVELVCDGETGLTFERGNAGQLRGVLETLIHDAGLRRSLAANGARLIRERFSLTAAARRMGEIYASCLAAASA